ncbi:MAG: hypothetical protein HYU44_11265 [Betaproteobacteria bacterium]|nr:hypothetical protein [Betaproteobacteria bacterium]
MNETKADMYGSYLAMFSFAIVMIVLPLFFDSKVGSVLWALVAWQIYRRDKPTLIVTLRLLFWFIILGAIVSAVWLLLGPPNANLRQFVEVEGFGLAISAGVLWWMHSFFEKSATAADIFNPVMAQAPVGPGIATVESPAPPPVANIVAAQAPASAEIATVETAAPRPPAEKVLTRVFGRAKRVMSWRRRLPKPASAGNSAAVSGDPDTSGVTHAAPTATVQLENEASARANTGRLPDVAAQPTNATQNAARVATKTVDTAPAPPAVPRRVANLLDVRAEPSVSPKAVPPESQAKIPLPTIIDDERIYAEIAGELETGGIDKGLWTRLYAECDGDEKRTKVLYIRQRAERLIAAERARRLK